MKGHHKEDSKYNKNEKTERTDYELFGNDTEATQLPHF